jgi:uncharacterized protein YjbJ (UPF0337 family)
LTSSIHSTCVPKRAGLATTALRASPPQICAEPVTARSRAVTSLENPATLTTEGGWSGSSEEDQMKDDLKREIKGKVDNIKGRVKEAIGALSGNKETQAEGTAERAAGAANEKVGEVERKVGNALGREESEDE